MCALPGALKNFGLNIDIEAIFAQQKIDHMNGMILGRMSPATAFGFLIATYGVYLSLRKSQDALFSTGLLLVLFGAVFIIGYQVNTPLLYGTEFIPPAFTTSLCLTLIGFALILSSSPSQITANSRLIIVAIILFEYLFLLAMPALSKYVHPFIVPAIEAFFLTALILPLFHFLLLKPINASRLIAEDLYHNAPCGFHSIDREGIVRRINETELRWFGYERDEVVGKLKGSDLVTPRQRELFFSSLKIFLDTGHIENVEVEFRKKNGESFWGLINATAIQDSRGKISGSRSTITDITELKLARQKIEQDANEVSTIFQLMSEGVIKLDDQGIITIANAAFCLMCGYERNEIIGKHIEFFFESDQYLLLNQQTNQRHFWDREPFELTFRRKDRSVFVALISPKALVDANGNLTGAIGIISDITKRKQAESEKEILHAQLVHSDKLASIGTLAAGIAHEINNPLTIVSGNISLVERLLAEKQILEPFVEFLEKQKVAIKRIATIVKQLSVYARLDNSQVDNVSLHEVIKGTLYLTETIFSKIGINFIVDLSSENDLVRGNIGKLEQILMNLLINSRDALENNSDNPTITIKTYDRGDYVVLRVSDNGCGIKANLLNTIFDPFFTTKAPGKGTGLGLSISRSIIEAVGGKIEVESEIDKGTTFTIKFAAAQSYPIVHAS